MPGPMLDSETPLISPGSRAIQSDLSHPEWDYFPSRLFRITDSSDLAQKQKCFLPAALASNRTTEKKKRTQKINKNS